MTVASSPWLESVRSGDVELFFRLFGEPGATPLLILHGANYYDSSDWVRVAAELARDRQVCAYDARGNGRSSWSPSQNYSLDAQLSDIEVLLDHLGWQQALLVGHSRGGSFGLRFAHERPQRVAGLVLVDFSPGQLPGRARLSPLHVGSWGAVYESLEQAHAATSRDPGELSTAAGRTRAAAIFAARDGGWVNLRRDPAFQSERPTNRPDWITALAPLDLWDALSGLAGAGVPALVVRATRSAAYDDVALARLRNDFKAVRVTAVDSGHDVPGAAAGELVAALRGFLLDTRL
jgi:pimeloyl-ACP methyl ester carboxylesterase